MAGDESPKKSLAREKLLYMKEHAGPDLKLVRMAVPLKDTEDEDLLDYLEVCLDFIEEGRSQGSVLVHCFAGVSRRFTLHLLIFLHFCTNQGIMNFEYFFFHCSAAVITAYLMRKEQKSLEGLNDILSVNLYILYITFLLPSHVFS